MHISYFYVSHMEVRNAKEQLVRDMKTPHLMSLESVLSINNKSCLLHTVTN